MRRRTDTLFWLMLAAQLLLFTRCSRARAEEPPCRRDGANVVCGAADFKLLTDALIDCRGASSLCDLREAQLKRELADANRLLEACRRVPPEPPARPPEITYSARPALAVTAALIGAVAASAAALAPLPPEGAVTAGVGGAVLMLTSIWLVLP